MKMNKPIAFEGGPGTVDDDEKSVRKKSAHKNDTDRQTVVGTDVEQVQRDRDQSLEDFNEFCQQVIAREQRDTKLLLYPHVAIQDRTFEIVRSL